MAEALHMLEWFHQDDPDLGITMLEESMEHARAAATTYACPGSSVAAPTWR